MESIQPLLAWLHAHLFVVVLVSSFVDATGLPFPGRAILVVAGGFAGAAHEVVLLIATSVLGSLLGDHVLYYYAGMRGGTWLLALYCRLSLGSARCVEVTLQYFKRFGALAVLLARCSTGVRLFAAILAGTGHISYRRFVVLDLVGTIGYAALWIVLGFLFGEIVLERAGPYARALLLLVPTTLMAILGYRLWRRWRYGIASRDLFPPR